jgi:hypothetical protein
MPIEAPKKKRTFLPLLTILFLFSYGLMTVLIMEQGSAIQQQRNLIKVLMRDSTELWAIKGKAITDKQAAQTQTQSHARSTQNPSSQTPSAQAPSTQVPSSKAPQSHSSRTSKVAKPGSQVPPMPASDLVDQRRSLRTI